MPGPADSFSDLAVKLFGELRARGTQGPTAARRSLVVAVTSAAQGEGKSFVAEGLAMHAAALGPHRILLVDANCHRPTLTARYKVGGHAGLTDFARGDAPELLPSTLDNLRVVGIGRQPQPLLLFRDAMVERFVGWAAEQCDVLMFDTGALGEPGSAIVTAAVGRILLVIDAGRTARDTVRDAVGRFVGDRERIWGVALNKRRGYIPRFIERRL